VAGTARKRTHVDRVEQALTDFVVDSKRILDEKIMG
jgi:hypothetical protein